VLAEDAVLHAEAVVAGRAELAAVTVRFGFTATPVADLHALHRGADLHDLAGDIAAGPEGQRRLQGGMPSRDEDIEVIERARLHADEHLVGLDLGICNVLVLQLVGTANSWNARAFMLSVELLNEARKARIAERGLLSGW